MTQSPTSFPEPIALDDLCQTTFPPTDWIIQGLLPAGLTLLAGQLRTGKSRLARQLAFSVSTGQSAFDKFPTTRATVLYLGLDDIPRRMIEHSQHHLQNCPPPHNFFWQNSWPPLANGGLDALETWLQQHPTTRLVVIDSFSQFQRPTSPSAIPTILTSLKRIASTYHISILLTHQTHRTNPKDPLSSLATNPAFTSIPDAILLLHPNYSNKTASIHCSGYDLETRTLTLAYDLNDSCWTLSPTSFHAYTLTPPRSDILKALNKAGQPLSPSEIALALNREPARIRRLLYSMVRSGLVHTVENGRYVPLITLAEASPQSILDSILFPDGPDDIPSTPMLYTDTFPPTIPSYGETSECRNAGTSQTFPTTTPYAETVESLAHLVEAPHISIEDPELRD